MLTFVVIALIGGLLALKVWRDKTATETNNGIMIDSKANMKEFMLAILKDNEHQERVMGFTDMDIIEIFEQSIEIMMFNDEVSSSHTNILLLTNSTLACEKSHIHANRPEDAP